jgi:DNA-binding CsgD family transcriptional regulator
VWRVPEGIRAFIANRLAAVSVATRRVLQGAAVVGTQFDIRLVRAVIDDLPSDQIPIAIADAHSERIVADAGEPGCYQFNHVLVRDVLYQDLPALDRARMHERIGAALEADERDGLTPRFALLAHHFGAALPTGSSAKAIAYASAAAKQACAQLAYEEAARYYGLALRMLDQAAAHDPRVRCKLAIALASAQMKAGHAASALDAFAEAADQARRLGATDDLAQAALELEETVWRLGLPGARAIPLLEASLERLRDDDCITRARLQSSLARALAFAGEADRADRLQRETLQLARRVGDPQALEAALRVRFWLRWEPPELEALLAASDEAIALAGQLGNTERVLDATAFRMHLLTAMGDLRGFASDLQRFAQLADELHQPFHQYHAASMRAAHALSSGRFAEAETLSRTALRVGARLHGLDASGAHGMQMFTIARERGELAQLAPLVRDFVRATPSANTWRPALALILAELGELDAAKTELRALAADDFRGLPRDSLWLTCLAYLSEVCELVRDSEHAGALYALLGPWQGCNVIAGSVVVCYGPVDRFLGALCHVLGRWDDAERHFRAAVEMSIRQGSKPWLAHAQYRYAALLLERNRDGDVRYAHTLMASAVQVAEELDMRSLNDRLRALERQIGVRQPATLHPAGLSGREAQVLVMIAEGRSNRQIADAIFRSPNTVANHVRSILAKLGAANRTEAAAFAAHRG